MGAFLFGEGWLLGRTPNLAQIRPVIVRLSGLTPALPLPTAPAVAVATAAGAALVPLTL